VFYDDPTVNELEVLAARIPGKQAALFVPTGTQGNNIAIMAHTRRGQSVIMSRNCHIATHEAGGYAALSGVSACFAKEEDGIMDAASIAALITDTSDTHIADTGLICLENALSNGNVIPLQTMAAVYAIANSRGIPVHLDGARIFNAAVSLGVEIKELADKCDSIMFCLSKGLCAPVGSIVAGSDKFIAQARRCRKLLGGGMRQAGILAAAGIIALKKMPLRLGEDHQNARYLASLLQKIPGINIDTTQVKINLVFFTASWPQQIIDSLPGKMLERGVKILPGPRFRFATNNDISRADCDEAVNILRELI
jgi:threonine aldolase